MPALTLTNYNFSPNLVTFPKIYQRKFSYVNDVSMMIEVSIATVFSEVYFYYFLSFFSLFSGFSPSFVRRR